jgi:CRISPR-associated endonuclease Cas2
VTTYLVAYDVANCKVRAGLHRILCGYGKPVQKSVFRCSLDSVVRRRLDRELAAVPLGLNDSLLIEAILTERTISTCLIAGSAES